MKLSQRQQEVIDLMKQGWELGLSSGWHTWCSIQQGGQGKGGESRNININTLNSLQEKKLIEFDYEKYPTKIYRLCSDTKSTETTGENKK